MRWEVARVIRVVMAGADEVAGVVDDDDDDGLGGFWLE